MSSTSREVAEPPRNPVTADGCRRRRRVAGAQNRPAREIPAAGDGPWPPACRLRPLSPQGEGVRADRHSWAHSATGSVTVLPVGCSVNDLVQFRLRGLSRYRRPEIVSLEDLEGLPGGWAGGWAAGRRPQPDRPVPAAWPPVRGRHGPGVPGRVAW